MANFAILRVAKLKNLGAVAVSGQHNFRERETKNADGERLHLNQIEGAHSTAELVKSVSDLLPAKRRKDAVIGLEYLITASPEHFGTDWMERQNHGQDYFKDAVAWLEKLHGKENVICKTVHLDESTPHMAVYVVPLKDGKLNAKAFTGGRKALADMQTSFAVEVGAKHGLDRGVERSQAVHQDNAKIQPMTIERMQLRKQVKALSDEVERLTKRVSGDGAALAAAKQENEKLKEELARFVKEAVPVPESMEEKFARRAEEKRQRELEKMLMAAQIEPEYDRNALMDRWDANPATEAQQRMGTRGTIKAIEGPYVVQHIGRGVHVCQTLAKGVKAPSVGSVVTIKGGQVIDVLVQERGGLSR